MKEEMVEAGRALDALIAEKVMGLTKDGSPYPEIDGVWWHKGLVGTWEPTELPEYSTDIQAAWMVAERIKGMMPDHTFSIEWDDGLWRVDFVYHVYDEYNSGTASTTAPHAICLAALEATKKE